MHGITRGYIIAALPRTGSFLLCEKLAALGSIGYPQEYGLLEDWATWSDYHGYASHLTYFYDFFRFCSTPNGVFGCKLMWTQFAALRHHIKLYTGIGGQGLEPIEGMTGPLKVVFLDRRDIVMQAISLVRAMETNVWSTHHTLPPPALVYSRVAINDAIHMIEENRRQWEALFTHHAVDPLRLFYEDITRGEASAIFPFLRVKVPERVHATHLKQQADDYSLAWRDRFVKERASAL